MRKDKNIELAGRERKTLKDVDVQKILQDIRQSVEPALEHQASKAFRNNFVRVALEDIISLAKKGIDENEQARNSA